MKQKWQNEGDVIRHPDGIALVRLEKAKNQNALLKDWWCAFWRDGSPMYRKRLDGTLFIPRFSAPADAIAFVNSGEMLRNSPPKGK